MAGPTRLELATSGVTGRRSDQLNYDPARSARGGPRGKEIIPHSAASRADSTGFSAPAAARIGREVVGGTGFEPVTAGV